MDKDINHSETQMNTKNQTLVTIGMPVYNAGTFLKSAVESILEQTYKNWELLIIDDGSTDTSIDSLKSLGFLKDPRIKIFSDGNNRGLAIRLNEAIDMAKGKYFARMDGDDLSLPSRLEAQLAFLTRHPEVDLLATRVATINFNGELVGQLPFALTHEAICAKPWRSFYMPHPTWMGKTEWFRKFKYVIPAPYFCEDQELLLRSYTKSKFACLDRVLLHYRVRDKVNIRKLLGTYLGIYKMQRSHFFKNNPSYFVPATIVFFTRNIKIVILLIKQFLK